MALEAFENLKKILCRVSLLQYPDLAKMFRITTDASRYAVCVFLSHREIGKAKTIGYSSRVLKTTEVDLFVYENEAFTMVHGATTFRPYIYEKSFKIITDHQTLSWFRTAEPDTRV